MTIKLVVCAVITLAATGFAPAGAAPADGIDPISIRQVGMAMETGAFGYIRSVVAAKGDLKALESSARAIARWQTILPTLFPPGSEKGGDTRSLPEIWSDRAGFDKLAAETAATATRLAVAARADDADAVATETKALGAQCGACHRGYRAK